MFMISIEATTQIKQKSAVDLTCMPKILKYYWPALHNSDKCPIRVFIIMLTITNINILQKTLPKYDARVDYFVFITNIVSG